MFTRSFLPVAMVMLAGLAARAEERSPLNFVVIFADDLGYGDLGCFGHPTIRTPHLDRMAAEGQKWTSFYVAASVCTPSRAGLLTGRLPIRSGMCSNNPRVLFPNSKGGLPAGEVTLAEALKARGYATACIGKWHLGHLPPYLPTKHGFDTYFGIPYSNDMDRVAANAPRARAATFDPKIEYWNVPLMRDEQIIERPADQTTITKRYTQEAVKFIEANRDKPFFLYLPHNMPHVPLFRSKDFEGVSRRGMYGDVIEEIDWSVGQVLETLRRLDLDERTLVVFTSDNGPWLVYNDHGGSAGLLRDGKGCTFEGGMRVPTIFWQPGAIQPGVVAELGSTLDLLPTFVSLSGGKAPDDRVLDGFDLSPVLLRGEKSPRDHMFYYRGAKLYAVRKGPFKAHFVTRDAYGPGASTEQPHDPPLLYHLDHDPAEAHNVADQHPDVIADLRALAEQHVKTIAPVENQLER